MSGPRGVIGFAARAAVVALAGLGVFTAVERSWDTAAVLEHGMPASGISALDQERLATFARHFDVPEGSAEHALVRSGVVKANRKFLEQPGMTLLHVIPGALFLGFALLQFAPSIRKRHPALHRRSGRALLATALVVAISGMYFGLVRPHAGLLEASATGIFGAFMIFSGVRAWVCIRQRRVALHREWMIRMFATGIAIVTIRVIAALLALLIPIGPELVAPRSLGLLMWTGWIVTLLAAEAWIRLSRREEEKRPAEAGRFLEA